MASMARPRSSTSTSEISVGSARPTEYPVACPLGSQIISGGVVASSDQVHGGLGYPNHVGDPPFGSFWVFRPLDRERRRWPVRVRLVCATLG